MWRVPCGWCTEVREHRMMFGIGDTSSPSFPLSWFYCNLFIAAHAMIPPPKPPSYGTCPQKGACIIIVASTRAGGSSIGCSSRLWRMWMLVNGMMFGRNFGTVNSEEVPLPSGRSEHLCRKPLGRKMLNMNMMGWRRWFRRKRLWWRWFLIGGVYYLCIFCGGTLLSRGQ